MVEKKESHSEHSHSQVSHKLKNMNFWMVASVVLAVLLVAVLIFNSVNKISKNTAAEKLTEFAASQGVTLNVTDVRSEGSLYAVDAEIQGQQGTFYVSKDGKYFTASVIPLSSSDSTNTPSNNQNPQPTEVTKSDKPVVELFIMSYCPYGTQMEKAILPVVAALGDKIDFTLRYTHFTLHGEKEDTENYRQLCIREEQPSKFLPYIQCTLNSTDPYAPADVNACMKKLGIDTNKVSSCMSKSAGDYFKVDSQLSQGYAVQGSPTLVINGVQVNAARSPAAVLSTVCSAFNTQPSECSTQLPTAQASPGFGYSSSSSADTAAIQCGV